jgi:hypothetical protein
VIEENEEDSKEEKRPLAVEPPTDGCVAQVPVDNRIVHQQIDRVLKKATAGPLPIPCPCVTIAGGKTSGEVRWSLSYPSSKITCLNSSSVGTHSECRSAEKLQNSSPTVFYSLLD